MPKRSFVWYCAPASMVTETWASVEAGMARLQRARARTTGALDLSRMSSIGSPSPNFRRCSTEAVVGLPTITARSRKADAPGVWRPRGSRGRYGSAVRAGPSLRRLTALSLVLACGVARGASGQPPPAARGLRVERVRPLFEAAKAGLQAGDVLLRWARGEERGELESPFE